MNLKFEKKETITHNELNGNLLTEGAECDKIIKKKERGV